MPANINSLWLNGSNGFSINDNEQNSYFGNAISGIGDINGDDVSDFIIGAPGNSSATGRAYLIYGNINGFPAQFNITSLNGQNGFIFSGLNSGDMVATSVSGLGDVNADGFDDLIIGAPGVNTQAGQAYVVFGNKLEFPLVIDSAWLNGKNGFAINGISRGDLFGSTVSEAGDINGDGIADIMIGAPGALYQRGQVYIIYGSKASFNSTFNAASLNGNNGFIINGINAYYNTGSAISGAGDLTGDGIDDILIGAYGAASFAGQAYVLYGQASSFEDNQYI